MLTVSSYVNNLHPADLPRQNNHFTVFSWSILVVGYVLSAMAKYRITSADVGYRGTQLKMTLVLEGQQQVIFKPRWYNKYYFYRTMQLC